MSNYQWNRSKRLMLSKGSNSRLDLLSVNQTTHTSATVSNRDHPVATDPSSTATLPFRQIRLTSVIDTSLLHVTGGLHANLRLLTPWTEMLFVDLQHTPKPYEFDTRLVGSMGGHSAQLKTKLIIVAVSSWCV